MLIRRQVAMGFVLVALLCTGKVGAQVLDQVPDNAMVVLKIKNLEQLNRKIAKAAKDLGLDQLQPELSDPLGKLEQETKLTKGINKAGDVAIVMFDPTEAGGPDKSVMVLVPTSDYKAFLSNFKNPQADGDITKARTPDDSEDIFVVKRGDFAAVSPVKELLTKKPSGLKLKGAIAKEAETKDALFYANMTLIRPKLLPELEKRHKDIASEVEGGIGQMMGEAGKDFIPVIKAVINQLFAGGKRVMEDSTGAAISLGLNDVGLSATMLTEFEPASYLGKIASETKNTEQPLVVGLPGQHRYLAYGGSTVNPESAKRLINDMFEPIVKELQQLPKAKSLVEMLDSAKIAAGATSATTFGWVAPTAPLGTESLFSKVVIARGDAKTIHAAQRTGLAASTEFMKMLPQQQQASAELLLSKDAKTVGGVKLDSFQTKLTMDDKDPNAAQVQQVMSLIYGPAGMSGVMGAVDDKTFITVSGGNETFAADVVAAAKDNSDSTLKLAGAQAVGSLLPKSRAAVVYVELGNMVGTIVRYAKDYIPINANLQADLPPIGATVASEGSTMRADALVPMDLVKGLVRFGLEARQQGGKPGGGLQ